MTVEQTICSFFEGMNNRKDGNIRIVDDILYSYDAAIARRVNSDDHIKIQITNKKYSVTTSKHTNMARMMAQNFGFEIEDKDLTEFGLINMSIKRLEDDYRKNKRNG